MQRHLKKIHEFVGVMLKDWLRYESDLRFNQHKYLMLQNRVERIAAGPEDLGYVCLWPHTSKLHAPLVMPHLGRQLLKVCMAKSTFQLKESRTEDSEIILSVLIGHRGMERLQLLLLTLRSIAAQTEVNLECIIIEQDTESLIREYLPEWVRYLFLKTETSSNVYNRSAGFNHGVKHARGKILLLHDNDMLMPNTYCKDIVTLVSRGYEAINTKRYVFHLTRSHSEKITSSLGEIPIEAPEYIIQNLEAGGSMAITRTAYFAIGGMDEEFVGWGGEDIEFWKRCSLLKRWIWGYQPILHLWHQSQPLKNKKDNPNIDRLILLDNLDLKDRINSLRLINWGEGFHV
jgi:hypothetical protein